MKNDMYVDIVEKLFQKNSNVVTRCIAGITLLIPIKRPVDNKQNILTLNETAVFIWERLNGINTIAEIKNQLQEQYEVSSEQAEGDILNFVLLVEELDLIRLINYDQMKGQRP